MRSHPSAGKRLPLEFSAYFRGQSDVFYKSEKLRPDRRANVARRMAILSTSFAVAQVTLLILISEQSPGQEFAYAQLPTEARQPLLPESPMPG